MSTVLMSIKPEYAELIFSGVKKCEYRKVLCKRKVDKIIVYESNPIKKVVGEIYISDILYDDKEKVWKKTFNIGGIDKNTYDKYFKNKDRAVAFMIEKTNKYDEPKYLSEYNIKMPPQSYMYLD